MAAEYAVVDYDTDNLEAPILSVEDAVKRSSFFEVPSFLIPKQVGDISKGMAEADYHINAAQVPSTVNFLAVIYNDGIPSLGNFLDLLS